MQKLIPSKGQLISGLVVFAIGYLIVNKVPAVARMLGNPNKGA